MRRLLSTLALGAALTASGPALAQSLDLENMTAEQRAAFGEQVREYLLENPEVIFEAIQILEERRNLASVEADKRLVVQNAEAIFQDGYSYETGNLNGDVTIVEFLDYRCGFCKRAHPVIEELLERDPNLKLVVKEFPILGPGSVSAGKMALAALDVNRDLYGELNDALMTHEGDLNEAIAYQIAAEVGYDVAELKDHAISIEVDNRLNENYRLARNLGLEGTPAFIIGDQIVRGLLPIEDMQEIIANLRVAQN